jgi:hypothetical protein
MKQMDFSSKEDSLAHIQAGTRYIMMRIVAGADDLPELHSQMLTTQVVRKEYLFPIEFIQLTVCRHCWASSQNISIHNLPPLSLGLLWEDWTPKSLLKRLVVIAPGLTSIRLMFLF